MRRGRPPVDANGTEAVTIVLPIEHAAALRAWAAEDHGAPHRYGGLVRGAVRRMLEECGRIAPRASQLALKMPAEVTCPPIGALRSVPLRGAKRVGCNFEYCPTKAEDAGHAVRESVRRASERRRKR